MSGRFEIDQARPGSFRQAVNADSKHEHVVLWTHAGVRVAYFDPRRFGFMGLIPTAVLDEHAWFAALGPEPLGENFDGAILHRALSGRRQNIKVALLDQSLVAGIGNIYACEALFAAGIDPGRRAGDLTKAQAVHLATAVKSVLAEAIEAGGSTLRDFAAADGALGYFQHRFRVYGRKGQPCFGPCAATVARLVQGGRSTFYCPDCQS